MNASPTSIRCGDSSRNTDCGDSWSWSGRRAPTKRPSPATSPPPRYCSTRSRMSCGTGVELETYILSRAFIALHAGDYAAAIEALDAAHPDLDDPTTTMSYAVVRCRCTRRGRRRRRGRRDRRPHPRARRRTARAVLDGEPVDSRSARRTTDLAQSTPRGASLDLAAYERAEEIAAAWHKTRERLDGAYPHAEAHTLAVGAELALAHGR